jgi:hypothetical protein
MSSVIDWLDGGFNRQVQTSPPILVAGKRKIGESGLRPWTFFSVFIHQTKQYLSLTHLCSFGQPNRMLLHEMKLVG